MKLRGVYIKSTPFGHFLDNPSMRVNNALIDDICSRWVGDRKFHFGGDDGHVLEVTTEDIRLIFNLPYRGLLIKLDISDHGTHLFRGYLSEYWMNM